MSVVARKKKGILDYVITVASKGGNRLFMLVVTVLIARLLGAESFGFYSLFFGVFIVLFQSFAGVNIAYVRNVKLNGKDQELPTLKLSLIIQLLLSLAIAIIGWPISTALAKALAPVTASTFYLGFLAAAFIGLYTVWFGYFQARGHFLRLGLVTMLFNALILVIIGLYYLFNPQLTLNYIISIYALTALVLGCIGGLMIYFQTRGIEISREVFTAFGKMTLVNIAITSIYFLYRYIDVYFIQYFLDLTAVGIYSAAMKTSMLLNILVGALPTVLLPKAITSISSHQALKKYFVNSYGLAGVVVLGFFVFWLICPYFLTLLFGEEYSSAGDILKWLVIGWMLNVLYIPIAQLYYALNRVGYRLSLEIVKLVATVLLLMVLIPVYGAIGAAYALAGAIALALLISVPLIFWLLRIHRDTPGNTTVG